MRTPEVCRVHLGSFWEEPLQPREQSQLLQREHQDLLGELDALPCNAVLRRINELSKRGRYVKVHCFIIHFLRKQMPVFLRKQEKQQRLLDRLDLEFTKCAHRYGLSRGDFPEVLKFRQALMEVKDISKFKKLDKSKVKEMESMFANEIPLLLERAAAARV
jgi:EH domain-containing protein 1